LAPKGSKVLLGHKVNRVLQGKTVLMVQLVLKAPQVQIPQFLVPREFRVHKVHRASRVSKVLLVPKVLKVPPEQIPQFLAPKVPPEQIPQFRVLQVQWVPRVNRVLREFRARLAQQALIQRFQDLPDRQVLKALRAPPVQQGQILQFLAQRVLKAPRVNRVW
jgi:hypothetical protein